MKLEVKSGLNIPELPGTGMCFAMGGGWGDMQDPQARAERNILQRKREITT